MAGAVNDVLVNVLQKLNLGHLTENFQREKITVDQISKLSRQEMELLGVNDSKAMMSLRLQCLHYGSNPPPRIRGTQSCGAPEYVISKEVLEGYRFRKYGLSQDGSSWLEPVAIHRNNR